MASTDDTTASGSTPDPTQAAAPGADLSAAEPTSAESITAEPITAESTPEMAAEAAPAPRKRSTRSLESRQAAAKKAAATRARKKAEAAARLAAEQEAADAGVDTEPAPAVAEPEAPTSVPAAAPADEPSALDVADSEVTPAATTSEDEVSDDAAFGAAEPEGSLPAEAPTDAAEAPAAAPSGRRRRSAGRPAGRPAPQAETADVLPDPMEDPVVLAARERAARVETERPAVPSFGLLFQAPDPDEVLDLRAGDDDEDDDLEDTPDTAATDTDAPGVDDAADPDDDQGDDEDSTDEDDDTEGRDRPRGSRRSRRGRRRRGRGDDRDDRGDAGDHHDRDDHDDRGESASRDSGDDAADSDEDDDSGRDDAEDSDDRDSEGGRRRRRRGGRGRNRSSRGGDDDSGRDDAGDSDDRDSEDSDDAQDSRGGSGRGSDAAEQGEGESTGRRRRRRRRSGAAGEGDDPPGTVTKVRQPRETATGIKGSTRLEAKRQRRREGREAGRRRTIITEAEFLARRESVERVMVVRERGPHTQIGVLEDGILVEHYISGGGTAQGAAGAPGASMAGNVYLGRVQNVLPSMEAAFVDIGRGRNAVLYAGEVNWDAAGLEQHKARRIENALSNGQSVLVQVTKDPIGHKGARLTSQVSLPGRYLVYVPDGSMTGISRKLPDTERARLKKILKQIVPDDAGVIVRTAAEGASEAELTADVERLQRAWEKIQKKAKTGNAPVLLHGEADLTTRVVRDVFNEDFTKLVVSGEGAWESISDYVESVAPDLADRLQKWTGERDVFAEYRVDEQIAKAMDRKVWLPSGGSVVIDRTEAMTVIDVNTGKFTGSGGNLEETVTKNNIEAAEEIVRQLRLRDIGGIIVVDFIDMVLESNRELVVRRLVECLGRDRTKHQVAEVTSLGLVQMTRKRVGAGLIEVFGEECEHCHGRGIHVSTEPLEKSGDSGHGHGRDGRDERGGRGGRRNERARREVRGSGTRERDAAPQTPSGPTPAQIAAAAYAAAVQSHEHGDSTAMDEDAPMETAAVEAIVAEHLDAGEVPVPTADDAREGAPAIAEPASTPRRSRGSRRASAPSTAPADPVVAPGASLGDDTAGHQTGRVTGRVTGKAPGVGRPTVADGASEAHEDSAHGAADRSEVHESAVVGTEVAASTESGVDTLPSTSSSVSSSPAAESSTTSTPEAAPKRRRGSRRAASAPTAAPSGSAPVVFTAEEAATATEVLTSTAPKTVLAAAAASSESPAAEAPAAETPAPKRRRAVRRAAGAPAGPPRPVEGE